MGAGVRRPGAWLAQWRVAAVQPGAPVPADDDPLWTACDGPGTAAAALRAQGRWSLAQADVSFDALDWWWQAQFDAPPGLQDGATLGLDGLATLAQVSLNGQPLLDSDNMFVRHRVVLAPGQLHARGNTLLIRCAALQPALARKRPRPRWRVPMLEQQQLRWLRTTLLGRTPGWSPPAAPVGPWRDVWLRAPDDLDAVPFELLATLAQDDGEVRLAWHPGQALARRIESAELLLEHAGVVHRQALASAAAGASFEARLAVPRAVRWWPHTHGEPHLYRATLRIVRRDGGQDEIALGHVGFRTIEVDRSQGRFQLRVNGVPVFCRGAGWTPLDPVSLRSTPQQCESAVAQARQAGLNMLRVAGTLVYEEDHFYAACDAQGVLVWQDFMFASMDYPGEDAAFVRSATLEARQQVQRLRSHACLAVLCGNSEVEQQAAMWGAPRELWQPRFFHETLAAVCAAEAPAVCYWPSSTHGGAFPHQASAGTTSYYGVGAYQRPLEDARRSELAFATECLAFANIPDSAALRRLPGGLATRAHHPAWKQRSPRDLGAGWDFDDVRDHYVERLFGVRAQDLRYSDHERYLALGRQATAEAMAGAYAQWRRPGSGCGGALVLFLRDLWAGAGWGLLDDTGAPKACWHAVRRVLQPLAVLLTDEGVNGIHAHAINESPVERHLVLEVTAWRDGEVRVAAGRTQLTLPPRGSRTLACAELFDHFLDLGWTWRFGPPVCDAVVATLRDVQGEVLSQHFHFPVGFGLDQRPAADIGLAAQARLLGPDEAEVTVHTRRLALGVHLELPGWSADDDHFHLAPGERRCLRVHRTGPGELAGTLHALNTSTAPPVEAFA